MVQEELMNMDISGHDTSSAIEEELEEGEDSSLEREIMQMFIQSKGNDKKHQDFRDRIGNKKLLKEFMLMYKKNKGKTNKSKKTNEEVQAAYLKIKRQEKFKKRRHSSSDSNKASSLEVIPDSDYSTALFESVFEAEELFSDWNWNFTEIPIMEQIFEDWLWNMEEPQNLKMKFYDDQGTSNCWNDFNFWKPMETPVDISVITDNII